MLRGAIYMGDYNAYHPDLGYSFPIQNKNGYSLLDYVRRYRLTSWDIGKATHSVGAALNHIFTSGLVVSHVRCSSILVLFF